jgi:hypothetical protein
MNLILLMLLSVVPFSHREVQEHVDLTETNHFHDQCGRYVYTQTIFWEWDHAFARYHVRAWTLLAPKPKRDYRSGLYRVAYTDRDQNLERVITSTHYRETWSQVDPERKNKRLLDERDRLQLVKRSVSKPIEPIPDDAPMEDSE